MADKIQLTTEEKRKFVQWLTQKIQDKFDEPVDEKDYTKKCNIMAIAAAYRMVAHTIGSDK